MKRISKEEWKSKKRHGYTSIIDGQRHILDNVDGRTALVPVKVIGMRALKQPKSADVCLYGTEKVGFGWIAQYDGQLFGDGDPSTSRTQTDCLHEAHAALEAAGCRGKVQIFEPSGRRMATTRLNEIRYFGDLTWTAAPVYTINVEEVE